MRNKRQISFSGSLLQKSFSFGGSLLKNSNAKIKRPISHKNSMHLVLRSSIAKGQKSFLHSKNAKRIKMIIQRQALLAHIQIHEYANVGNHLHLLIKIKSGNHLQARIQLQKFFRSVTGLIARHILSVERGSIRQANPSSHTNSSSCAKLPGYINATESINSINGNKMPKIKFWDYRPFTRIIIGFRGYRVAKDYVIQNTLEALGIIPYQTRKYSFQNSS